MNTYLLLSGLSRGEPNQKTVVMIAEGEGKLWRPRKKWIEFRAAKLMPETREGAVDMWRLEAYLRDGATDFEHDSAYILRLPLVALKLTMVYNHNVHISAIVADDPDVFSVPTPDYKPFEGSVTCEHCEEPHPIVEEGRYMPPFDQATFDAAVGRQVEIIISG